MAGLTAVILPRRVLIANRGEIAVRVIAACHDLGIEAVAIYSDADVDALHVRLADAAVPIGGTSSAESYLRIDRVIAAAQVSGAAAIHPGYGFLSENADFAEACIDAGITFIGPSAEAMRLLGNKIGAKTAAEQVGVPVVPGYRGEDQTVKTLIREAARIGYPVLIKAAAGGGGRGMRVVRESAEVADAVEAATREALAAFGDGTVFLERYIERPRHIEVQVLADQHGTVIALGERECSLQRRHQKVIEEAPAPAVDEPLRAALGDAAVRLARAAGYVNAGTVEFLLDKDRNFYFLEMNTRLQVEHPVTELVTGLDLVAAQIRIAAGDRLPTGWQTLPPRGHAIEARLYAEDPAANFMPIAGKVLRFDSPHMPGVRIDAGVTRGSTISVHYDPLLAKVIAFGETRAAALARLREALRRSHILGLTTNAEYLQAILAHPAFAAGALHTHFLEEHGAELVITAGTPDDVLWAAAALAWVKPGTRDPSNNAWQYLGPWRHRVSGTALYLRQGNQTRQVRLRPEGSDSWIIDTGERVYQVQAIWRDGGVELVTENGRLDLQIARDAGEVHIAANGVSFRFGPAEPPSEVAERGHGVSGSTGLEAPMPGVLVKLHVHEGQAVTAHQPLVVLEAMKMEHIIAAPQAGVVRKLPFALGALVPAGATLVELALS